MKNSILSFLLGAAIFSLIAANSLQSPTVFKPAQPKQVLTESFRTMMGLENDIKKAIDKKVSEGWVVKSVAMMDDETFSKGIVVYEKY